MKIDFARMTCYFYPVLDGKYASLKNLKILQWERFNHLYRYAKLHTNFYRRHYLQFDDVSHIEDLPIVTKKILMNNFNDFLSDSCLKKNEIDSYFISSKHSDSFKSGRYCVWESSGTSGLSASFVIDQNCMAIYDNLQIQRVGLKESIYRLINPMYLGDKVAYIGADNGHFAGVCSFDRWRQDNFLSKAAMRVFSIFDPMEKIVNDLNEFQPTIIATYPSFALSLAIETERNLDISPKVMYFGGENLTSGERKYIKNIFNCDIKNSYGASEFLPMAWECDAQQMHLNSDWLILEPIDKNGRVIKDGGLSDSCLLTNLANYAQPLIRYELGDQIEFDSDTCCCGCTLPRIKVLGRKDDLMYFYKNSSSPQAVISPLIITSLIEDGAHVYNYQVIQQAGGDLLILLADHNEYKDKKFILIKVIANYMDSQGLNWVSLNVKHQELNRMASGKVKKVISRFH